MGASCYCCKYGGNADYMPVFKEQLLPFQNYSRTVDSLSRYDRFYRVVCYPLHCLKASEFFLELDALQRICDITVGCPMDNDLIPLHKFYEYYFDGMALWSAFLSDRECLFKKLVKMDGLFVPRYGADRIDFAFKRQSSQGSPAPDQELKMQKNLSENHYTGDKEYAQQHPKISNADLDCKRTTSVEFQKGELAVFGLDKPVVVESSAHDSFLRQPELGQMFKLRLEPSFIRKDKGIMRRDGITMSMDPKIDLFAIKILSLLMCRDSPKVKVNLFMETVLGRQGRVLDRETTTVHSYRVKQACKLLLFFSENFPKKFESHFTHELANEVQKTKENQTRFSEMQTYSDHIDGPLKGRAVGDGKNNNTTVMGVSGQSDDGNSAAWHAENVNQMDRYLAYRFDEIYEDIFVRELFNIKEDVVVGEKFRGNQINRKLLQRQVKHNKQWLFDPSQLRHKLHQHYEMNAAEV